MRKYATRQDAITREILDVLNEYADEFNIEAIAEKTIMKNLNGQYTMPLDSDTFCRIVEENAY